MKRCIIVGSIVLCCAVFLLRLAGGLHHQRFTRYMPISAATVTTESDFRPSLHPAFAKMSSRHTETLIPSLFYRHSETDHDPHIYLNLVRAGQPGFNGTDTLTFESLSIDRDGREAFQVIVPSAPRTIRLGTEYISWGEDLGAFEGDFLTLRAEGYITEASGDKKRFKHSQAWKSTTSSRTALGISIAE
jgi:hypothetical protein